MRISNSRTTRPRVSGFPCLEADFACLPRTAPAGTRGAAFDVGGARRQVDFKIDTRAKWIEEKFEIVVRNHSSDAVDVLVAENLYRGGNWTILSCSTPFEKMDARRIDFPIRVPVGGASTVRYRVRYTW